MKNVRNLCVLVGTAVLILAGCRDGGVYPWNPNNPGNPGNPGSGSAAVTIPDIFGVNWTLAGYEEWSGGTMTSLTPVSPMFTYTITFEEKGLHGGDECAVYSGDYTLGDKNALSIVNLKEPQVACGPRSTEDNFLLYLGKAESYQATLKTLRIFYAGGTRALYFTRTLSEIQIIPYDRTLPSPGDPFQLKSDIALKGDVLTMNVTYGGGCQDHTFDLFGPKDIPSGTPTPVTAYMIHHANNDMCKALVSRRLDFDLTPLKKQWQAATGKTSGEISLTISSFNVGGPDQTILYRF